MYSTAATETQLLSLSKNNHMKMKCTLRATKIHIGVCAIIIVLHEKS